MNVRVSWPGSLVLAAVAMCAHADSAASVAGAPPQPADLQMPAHWKNIPAPNASNAVEEASSNKPARVRTAPASAASDDVLKCGNWIYAGSKSSVCFSSKFLATVRGETNLETDPEFTPAKLGMPSVFDFPFAVMTGEGTFALQEKERENLKLFLARGGFLLASAGCSSKEWAQAFCAEIRKAFPDLELKKIPMDHPLFRTVYEIKTIALKKGGATQLEGLEINGRIVLVYSAEGLNDTANVKGCCCCGGNEIKNSQEINVNIFTYAVTH